MAMHADQERRALAAVRRYLPPPSSCAGFHILTGAPLQAQPLAGSSRSSPVRAAAAPEAAAAGNSSDRSSPAPTFGGFGRKEACLISDPNRPNGKSSTLITAKQGAKSRDVEQWRSDLVVAQGGRRHGRRGSPGARRRPPAREGEDPVQRPGVARRKDPELHGYAREPCVEEASLPRGLKASDLTESLYFSPRFSPPRDPRPDTLEAADPAASAGRPAGGPTLARHQGQGSAWPSSSSSEAVPSLLRSPEAVPVVTVLAAVAPQPAAPGEAAEAEAEAPVASAPEEYGAIDAGAPRLRPGPEPSSRPETAPAARMPASPASQTARRSESSHVERLAKARELANAPPAGAPVMENPRPQVSNRRGVSPGHQRGVLLASQWDGTGMSFAQGTVDAARASRRVEYVTMAQEASSSARDELQRKGGARTPFNAPERQQAPSSPYMRRRNSSPGFLTDGSKVETYASARREALEVAVAAAAPAVRLDKGRKMLERKQQWNLSTVV